MKELKDMTIEELNHLRLEVDSQLSKKQDEFEDLAIEISNKITDILDDYNVQLKSDDDGELWIVGNDGEEAKFFRGI